MLREQLTRWRVTLSQVARMPKYVRSSLIVGLGGLLNGLDTGTIGPVTSMKSFENTFGSITSSTLGIVVSSVLLSAAVTSLFAGSLADSLGRTRSIAIGALTFAIGAALEAAAINLSMLIIGRLIVGAGQGFFLSTMLVYVCEISPPQTRSTMATLVQLLITVGIAGGYFISYGTVNIPNSLSFRLPLAFQGLVALVLAIAAELHLPHSPRWLTANGRHTDAARVWEYLGVSATEREKETLEAPQQESIITVSADGASKWQHLKNQTRSVARAVASLFQGEARKPTILAIFFMTSQQLSGIDGVLYYAPILFSNAGLAADSSFLASGVSAIAIFVSTIVAVVYASRWGRRPTTIYGGAVLFVCMALMAMLYATGSVHADYGAGRWIVIPSIYIFACAYSMTWAIGLKLYASEIQPTKTRATGMALAQAANTLSNFLVALITPTLLSASSSSAYFLFGSSLLLTILISVAFMPETMGLDLESIGEAFRNHKPGDFRAWRQLRTLFTSISSRLKQRKSLQSSVATSELSIELRRSSMNTS